MLCLCKFLCLVDIRIRVCLNRAKPWLELSIKFNQYSLRSWHTGIPGLWTQELDTGLWTLDSGLWTLDSGRWTLEAGLWTLDSGRWTLDAGRWPLDADFKDGADIMLSDLACFWETKRYFNYSTNQKQGWQFLYYREIRHKETKHNEPFKGVLKKS